MMNNKKAVFLAIPLTAAASFLALSYSQPASAARPTSAALESSTSDRLATPVSGATAAVPVAIVSHILAMIRPTAEPAATKTLESAASNIYR